MIDNATRRAILDQAKAEGYEGSIVDLFRGSPSGPIVASTPQEQSQGLRPYHQAGDTGASMVFPDVAPNQSFNTVGMKRPIDIKKFDKQGHLVESFENVPPGITDLPMGPNEGMVLETPSQFQTGGFKDGNPYYYGPDVIPCRGEGCSEQATTAAANIFGSSDRNAFQPQDAWYKKAAVEKAGGRTVWTPESKDYSGIRAGDFISLDRPGDSKADLESRVPGYSIADNEGNEHVGVIVGKDPDTDKWLVRHGGKDVNTVVQPIDDLYLQYPGYRLRYSPQSIYRSPAAEGKTVDHRYYSKPTPPIDIAVEGDWTLKKDQPEGERKFMESVEANQEMHQTVSGLNPDTVADLNRMAFGIFNMETEAGETSTPIGGKMVAANVLYNLGLKDPASLSDMQIKYDMLHNNADGTRTRAGKYMDELWVTKYGLSSPLNHRASYRDEVNAAFAVLADRYKTLTQEERYEYDEKTGTVYGDIPLAQALMTSWKFPHYLKDEEKLRDATYGKVAMKHFNRTRKLRKIAEK